jgi:2-polyprenyl-3-methyl-5-hydroxy-6-metoxy-1,4-benzoquinol methylase
MESNKIWRKLKDTFTHSSNTTNNEINQDREKGEDYYNKVFEEKEMFHAHYTSSPYYGVWTIILDKIRRIGKGSILEIGCGTGQLAWAIYDSDLENEYFGFDFSEVAIQYAQRHCPELKFVVANALDTDIYDTAECSIVVSTEFLEHIERDLDVIKSIHTGTNFIGSVPSYPWRSHVRHFPAGRDVFNRYSEYFSSFEVIPVRVYETKTIHLFQGIKK